jgi:vacuolar-type H+-ATPase subunit D/Vma8
MERQWLYVNIHDCLTSDDLLNVHNSIIGSENIDKVKHIIWDATQVNEISIDNSDVIHIAAIDATASKYLSTERIKLALVSSSKALDNLIEKYISTAQRINIQWDLNIFGNRADAKQWLEID